MVKSIYTSDQTAPYLFLNRIIKPGKVKQRLYKYLECLQKNNIEPEKTKEVLKSLKEEGCTYAFVANALVESFINKNNGQYDDKKFQDIYGLSIQIDDDTIDSSILMVDIFSKLYNLSKFNIHKYDVRYYKTAKEAAKKILNVDIDDEIEAIQELFNNGYMMDYTNDKGEIRFVAKNPINISIIGTYSEIALKLFGIQSKNIKIEKLIELCKENNITFEEKYKQPASKLSGLTLDSINYWVNYYLNKSNIDLSFYGDEKTTTMEESNDFIKYIKTMKSNGKIIGVSAPNNSNVLMINPNTGESISITTQQKGHKMTLRDIDSNGNILVDSYGKDYVIKKEDIEKIVFIIVDVKQKLNKIEKDNDIDHITK